MAAKRKTVSRKAKKTTTTKKRAAAKRPAARKTAKKRATTKKTAARRAPAKRKAAKKKPAARKSSSARISSPLTKTELLRTLAENTDLQKKDLQNVLECLADIIQGHIKKSGPGQFTLPGLLKIVVVKKPATKARKGINPFTGEPTIFKAKPARNVVKIRPLKNLKEMAA